MLDVPTVGAAEARSSQLAKRFFGLVQQGDMAGMLYLLHPEPQLRRKCLPHAAQRAFASGRASIPVLMPRKCIVTAVATAPNQVR